METLINQILNKPKVEKDSFSLSYNNGWEAEIITYPVKKDGGHIHIVEGETINEALTNLLKEL